MNRTDSAPGLLANAESPEDLAEQVIGREDADNHAEFVVRQPQLLGHQIECCIGMLRELPRPLHMVARMAECPHVPRACNEHALAARAEPAAALQQSLPQSVQAFAGARRQHDGVVRTRRGGVALVVDLQRRAHTGGLELARDRGVCRVVVGLADPRQVVKVDHEIGLRDGLPTALNADALDLVAQLVVRSQAGDVDHVHRDTVDLDRLADTVARRAGHRRDDSELSAGQGIEQ